MTVASPCIGLCEMDAASGLCRGCLRTLDEIAAWGQADDAHKLSILAAVASRSADEPGCEAEREHER